MTRSSLYIYGVIHSNQEECFDPGQMVALTDIYPSGSPADAAGRHEPFNAAYTIVFRDVAAVVRDSEIVDCHRLPKETLARLLVDHQRLIENVMTRHSIIPMRLGTVAQDRQEVEAILSSGYRTMMDIFERTEDAIEMDVAVTLSDFEAFLREISQTPEIRQLKQSLLDKPDGMTPEDQMEAGLQVKRHFDREKETLALEIQTALAKESQEVRIHSLMDDTMVFNGAFLIPQKQRAAFEQAVECLNETFEDKLNFRCIGPLPTYSFYTLQVRRPDFEDVRWAKQLLGLESDFVTAREIQKARYKAALTCHPDKHPDQPGIEKTFDETSRAYKILLDYYRASNQEADSAEGCYLNEKAFEKTPILVTTVE